MLAESVKPFDTWVITGSDSAFFGTTALWTGCILVVDVINGHSISVVFETSPPADGGSHRFSYSSTRGTLANRFVINPISYVRTELGTEVGDMNGILADDCRLLSARSSLLPTVPSKPVDTFRGPCSLDDNASGICKPHRIMGCVRYRFWKHGFFVVVVVVRTALEPGQDTHLG